MAYWKYTYIFISLIIFSPLASAQDCGCINCPQSLEAGNNYQVCFEIVGALNDNLLDPNQGICGVELVFEHLRIEDLNMTLVSPAGQSVQLVGESDAFGFCGGVTQTANVIFVPDSETAMPMSGASATWDNEDFCQPGIQVEGSYHPYSGNLEDFNLGFVNGTWCLDIETTALSQFSGDFIDLNIILCDDAGLNCCFSDAGMLIESDTILCETDPYLDYDHLAPSYEFASPDALEYGYTYAVSEDGIILNYTDNPDLVDFAPGNYSICGISYRLGELAAFPAPNGVFTIDEFRDALNSPNPPLCGDVTTDCINIEIVSPITPTELDENVCEGDTFFVGNLPFFLPGSYEINLEGYGCDSLVMLELDVIDVPITTIDTTICINDVILIGDSTYFEDGTFENTLTSSENCDSIVILNLTVSSPETMSISETLCEGQCYTVGDSCYAEEGLHIINFQTEDNCDSLITLFLIVQPIHAEIAVPDSLGCGDDMVFLDGRGSDSNTNINFQWFYQDTAVPDANESTLMASDTGTYWLEIHHSTSQCRDTATVIVYENTRPPSAFIDTPDTLTCGTTSIELNGANSVGMGTLSYEWQSSTGNIDGATNLSTATVTTADPYTLIVIDDNNNCADTTSITVVKEEAFPTVNAGPDGLLTCEISQDTLDGTGSAIGPFIEYLWVTDTGSIVQDSNTLMPIVNADGAYTLIVTNTENGCADSAMVMVNQNMDLPNIVFATPDSLNCVKTTVQIDASASDSGSIFNFEWLTITGNIVPPTETTLQPTVDQPGIYELTITNTLTNCSQTSTINVEQEIIPPIAIATTSNLLTCIDTNVTLDASNSNGNNTLAYEWQNSNEEFISDNVSISVSTVDTFYLIVTDVVTQCEGRDTIAVMADTIPPLADAGVGFEIDCITVEDRLRGNNSTLGLSYLWTGIGIVEDETTLTPLVNQAGWYYLTVTNPSNGCTAIDSVEVTQDNNVPIVDAGETATLNCIDTCITLSASVMPVSNNFTIEWTVADGANIKSGADGLSPIINAAGTYTLTVRDTSNNCTATDVVIIDENTPNLIANAGADSNLDCNNPSYLIGDLSTSSGGSITYLWTTDDGHIPPNDSNLSQIEIDSAGTYVLNVVDGDSGCQASDTVVVTSSFTSSNIVIATPDSLTCSVTCVDLDASNTTGDGTLAYQWFTDNGHIKAGESTTIASVSEPGLYSLVVTNLVTGCMDTSTVDVPQDPNVPIAFTQDTIPIACGTGIARLEGLGSSTGDAYTYQWSGLSMGSNIVMGENNIAAEANAIGSYILIVTDTIRNCADSSIVVVTEDCGATPTVFADADTLNCLSTQTMLHGILPLGNNLSFEWYLLEDDEIINTTDLDIPISNGGTYIFTVTNNNFQTMASDTVVIIENREFPIANAGMDTLLTCAVPCVTLGSDSTSQGPEFSYFWETDMGNILDPDSLMMVKIDDNGIYTLTVKNLENGCSTTDAANVTLNQTIPDICFIPPFEIPCTSDTLFVDATCSTNSPSINHQWTTNDGSIISGAQNLTVRVAAAGMYYLQSSDSVNGCTALDSILITEQACNMAITATANDTLDCVTSEVFISATVAPATDDYMVSWTDSNGNEISDSLTAIVMDDGLYTFTANNLTTGEMDSRIVSVIRNETPPVADAGMPTTLDCDTDMATLDGRLSDQNTTVEWTSLGGHPINMANDFQATVVDTGIYQITVVSLENGCTASDQVIIDDNYDTPTADAGIDQEIACSASNTILSGENSTLTQTSLSWVALSGNPNAVCAGENTTNPIVCEAGTYILTVTSNINGCFDTDTVVVSLNQAAPTLAAGEDMMLNCETTTVELNGSGPPVGQFTVEWTNLNTNQNFGLDDYTPEVNEAATYEIRVTNIVTGCDSTDIVIVGIDTTHAIVDAGLPDTITCMDLSVSLSGNVLPFGNYDYSWTSADNNLIQDATTLTPSVTASGIYTLIATNNNNMCQDSAQVEIFQDENLPDVFAGNDTVLTCDITDITLMGDVPNAANLDLTWTNSNDDVLSNDLNLNITSTDTFTLTAFNPANNCSFSDAIIVTENTSEPTATISADATLLTCDIDSLMLDAAASSPIGNLSYEWKRNSNPTVLSNTANLAIYNPDTYILTVTNIENGCTNDTSIVITQDENLPIVNIETPDDLTCLVDTVVLVGSLSNVDNPMYIWTNENSDIIGNELSLTVTQEGNYTLSVVNGDNGCENSEQTFVENNEDLPNAVASITGDAVLDCMNTSVEVSAEGSSSEGDFSYQWTNNTSTNTSTSFNFMTNAVGTYILEVTNNETGCMSYDSIMVIADEALITGVDLTIQEQDCFGEGDATLFINQVIGGNAPFYYNLDEEVFKAFPQFDYLSPGDYALHVEDAFGCALDTLITIVPPQDLMVDLGEDQIIQLGDNTDISAEINGDYTSIKWLNIDSLGCADCLTQTVEPIEMTNYLVRVENENGCIAEDNVTIFVAKDRRVYLPNAFSPDTNDPNQFYTIFAGNDVEKILLFRIFDRWGNMVFGAENFPPNDPEYAWDGTLDGKPMKPAVFGYMIEVLYKDGYQEMLKGDIVLMR